MSQDQPRVITFVSGKGGSGKTTASIAISKLLSDMNFPCLLIDFDLATSGASYFFRGKFGRRSKGIWEVMAPKSSEFDSETVTTLPISISEDFFFVASRVNLTRKGKRYDSISFDVTVWKDRFLRPLIDWAAESGIAYVLVDCQSGYNISSLAGVEVADLAIIVTEADAISSDAADSLLIQLGDSLPADKRYLVNKIDVRDAETYREMRDVFQALDRLPPLPFDFAVRNAFGARQIPVDLDVPSPFLFGLFETVKSAFPEMLKEIESYREKHIDELLKEYDERLQILVAEREKLEDERVRIKTRVLRTRYDLVRLLTLLLATVAGAALALFTLSRLFPGGGSTFELIFAVVFSAFAGVTIPVILLFTRRRFEVRAKDEALDRELSRRIERVDRELDQFRSYLWAKSREYFVDIEATQEGKRLKADIEDILGKPSRTRDRRVDRS